VGGYQVGQFGGVILTPTQNADHKIWLCPARNVTAPTANLVGQDAFIVFRIPQNYPANLQIEYRNGTVKNQEYSDFSLLVQSSATLEQNQINRSIGASAIVGFFFVVLDLVPEIKKRK
jgi:hypothetical protein